MTTPAQGTLSFVVTANELTEGYIVYLRDAPAGPSWTRRIEEATVTAEPERRDALLAAAAADVARNVVVGPYAVEVKVTPLGLVHTSMKERVRATGPSVGNSLRKPAA
jgi:uncharacterized protein DUF2849